MHIVHVGELDFARDTGSGSAVWGLITALKRLGCSVTVIRAGAPPTTDEDLHFRSAGIKLEGVPGARWAHLLMPQHVCRQILHARPDVVHFHGGFIPLHPRIAARLRSLSIPYVVTTHGTLNPNVFHRSRLRKSAYFKASERRYLIQAAGCIGLTKKEKKDIEQLVPGQQVQVIGNGLDRERLDNCSTAYHQASGRLSGPEICALFLGRYDVQTKGLDFLFSLVREVRKRGVPLRLELHGLEHPPSKERMQVLAKGATGFAEVMPAVYGSAKWDALQRADIYIQTSRWDAFSIAVTEAMAAGLPIILSEHVGNASIVKSAGAGIELPFDLEKASSKLASALSDRDSLRKMGERGRSYVLENLTADHIALQTKKFYEQVLLQRSSL